MVSNTDKQTDNTKPDATHSCSEFDYDGVQALDLSFFRIDGSLQRWNSVTLGL
jgi:hypothetical protein